MLVAFVPLILATLGIAGTILRVQGLDATDVLLGYLGEAVPAVAAGDAQLRRWVLDALQGLIEQSPGLLTAGTLILAWVATRLIATLRTVLKEIFDLQQERSIIGGKLFDLKMVLAAGTLFAVNVGVTVGVEIVARFGFEILGLEWGFPRAAQLLWGQLVAFLVLWFMFLLIYRYLPARRIGWPTALIAATFTSVFFEILKQAFGWYVTNVAHYGSTYGTFAVVVVLILWIYYSSVVFILGGEVAQVVMMGRTRRRQKERLQ